MKTQRFTLRLTPEERHSLDNLARKAGLPQSEYLLGLINTARSRTAGPNDELLEHLRHAVLGIEQLRALLGTSIAAAALLKATDLTPSAETRDLVSRHIKASNSASAAVLSLIESEQAAQSARGPDTSK